MIMQKKRHAFCMTSFLWAVLLLLSACDHASGSNAVLQSDITKAESTQTTTDNALKQIHPSDVYADSSAFVPMGELECLYTDSYIDGYASNEGYYRFVAGKNGMNHLMYTDFSSAQEVYLCNQPNCEHKDSACTAVFPTFMGFHAAIPVGDTVVIVNGGASDYSAVLGDDALPSIELMTPDGSERKKVFTFGANEMLCAQLRDFMARDDENLYFVVQKQDETQKVSPEDGIELPLTTRTLCAINVKSGNVFELLNLSETEEKISGVDGQSLILTYVPYTYDLSIDMDSLQLDTARLDLSTLQTTSLFDLHYVQPYACSDGIFYTMGDDRVLKRYDLQNGSQLPDLATTLPESLKICYETKFDGIHDGYLTLHTYTGNENDRKLVYYSVDITNGITTELNHVFSDENGNALPGVIFAETPDKYLFMVGSDIISTSHPMAGGMSESWVFDLYRLATIDKTAYWQNSKDYAIVKTTE